jgi:hypothetical protein
VTEKGVTEDKKQMTLYAAILALVTGSGGWASFAVIQEYALKQGDERWVTISSQNLELEYEIEDELSDIQNKIDRGEATTENLIRKAVLQERLKQLELDK